MEEMGEFNEDRRRDEKVHDSPGSRPEEFGCPG
jgi:hypothetical protein